MRAPNHDQELKAFEAADSWKRGELIEKGGWDKMPGQGRPAMLWLEPAPGGLKSLPQSERCYAMALTFTACSPPISAVTSEDTFCIRRTDLEV